ncbi:MAG TPA: PfkB family carbohydrate kinase, partial [Arenibaculum sp.]|nr:PfkB family carbohydrate kinase [Arenibaculum sp.]
MPAILTLTMNPAVDLSTTTDVVVPTEKLRCSSPALDPGGGGINVARVVTRLRGTAHAIYPRGGPTGDLLDRLVAGEGISIRPVPVEGMTRYSFTVDERKSGDQFRFVLPGPALREREWRAVLDQIGGPEREGALLVLSGSLPPGVPDDFHARVAGIARERGFRIVLDSSGPALQQAVAAGVWLIKPNREEF